MTFDEKIKSSRLDLQAAIPLPVGNKLLEQALIQACHRFRDDVTTLFKFHRVEFTGVVDARIRDDLGTFDAENFLGRRLKPRGRKRSMLDHVPVVIDEPELTKEQLDKVTSETIKPCGGTVVSMHTGKGDCDGDEPKGKN